MATGTDNASQFIAVYDNALGVSNKNFLATLVVSAFNAGKWVFLTLHPLHALIPILLDTATEQRPKDTERLTNEISLILTHKLFF
jgi:hypothetical protein